MPEEPSKELGQLFAELRHAEAAAGAQARHAAERKKHYLSTARGIICILAILGIVVLIVRPW
jgi:hypothetical protein